MKICELLIGFLVVALSLSTSPLSSSFVLQASTTTRPPYSRTPLPYLSSSPSDQESQPNHPSSSSTNTMFTLLVVMKFKTPDVKSKWCESLRPLADYVDKNEPNTLQYMFSEGEEDPLTVTIFETYVSKSDFENVHQTSDEFKAHIERMKPYEESGDIWNESFITGNQLPFGYFKR